MKEEEELKLKLFDFNSAFFQGIFTIYSSSDGLCYLEFLFNL
jgi:hypothetical protein